MSYNINTIADELDQIEPEQPSNAEIKDIIECIIKWDVDNNSDSVNSEYLKIIRRDLIKAEQPREQEKETIDKLRLQHFANWWNSNSGMADFIHHNKVNEYIKIHEKENR